jgi:hypothetical protein
VISAWASWFEIGERDHVDARKLAEVGTKWLDWGWPEGEGRLTTLPTIGDAMSLSDPSQIAFIGSDVNSPESDCAAVWRDDVTGDFYFRGRLTDPGRISRLNVDVTKSTDEADVWLPSHMADVIQESLNAYTPDRHGPGVPSFDFLLEHTKRSAIHLEMRDAYDADDSFAEWQRTGDVVYDWSRWKAQIAPHIERGVKFRRLRIIAEPASDYIRWEHAISDGNVEAGEDLRWLPRSQAFDLMLPGADLWLFDQRRIRFGIQRGDGHRGTYELSSDPRLVRDVVASFEMAWERATPHADYKIT